MSFSNVVQTDTLRSLANGSIGANYAAVGSALTHPARMIRIINGTDKDMLFSDDGTNNKWIVPTGSYVLYDYSSNANNPSSRTPFCYATGTTFYVKQVAAPSSGSVYIEITYAKGE